MANEYHLIPIRISAEQVVASHYKSAQTNNNLNFTHTRTCYETENIKKNILNALNTMKHKPPSSCGEPQQHDRKMQH